MYCRISKSDGLTGPRQETFPFSKKKKDGLTDGNLSFVDDLSYQKNLKEDMRLRKETTIHQSWEIFWPNCFDLSFRLRNGISTD
jgi:hypothetical protein